MPGREDLTQQHRDLADSYRQEAQTTTDPGKAAEAEKAAAEHDAIADAREGK